MRSSPQYFVDGQSGSRVLVVVFLRGGADGLTLVPPIGDDAYHRARPTVRVKPESTIKLDGYFALHTDLKPLMEHFEAGRLSIVQGAGSTDTTRSHFEAQDLMEHGGTVGGGWLGRFMRARGIATSPLETVAIGAVRPESMLGAPTCAVVRTLGEFALPADDPSFIRQLAAWYGAESSELSRAAIDTLKAAERLGEIAADDGGSSTSAAYPADEFGEGLRELAKLIKADVGLAAATIDLGGWDTHFVQSQIIGGPMRTLGEGLAAFMADLGEHRRRVDVVAMTEFGRRVAENTSFGTDHGAGSVMMVLSEGNPEGGRVVSGWRDLSVDRLIGPGDVPVGIDYRDVLRPLLNRHSPGADVSRVFPGHAFA
jgi:uncharacterized protein (DUF1501 family)